MGAASEDATEAAEEERRRGEDARDWLGWRRMEGRAMRRRASHRVTTVRLCRLQRHVTQSLVSDFIRYQCLAAPPVRLPTFRSLADESKDVGREAGVRAVRRRRGPET